MPNRIAVIDRRIVSQSSAYHGSYETWVVGARRTLEVLHHTNRQIVEWIRSTTPSLDPPVNLDLIAHGGGGRLGGSREVTYVVRLGNPGLYSVNVHQWRDVQGLIRKIRVFTCGVESGAFPEGTFTGTSSASQHQLMKALARETNAPVKYSLNTMTGDVARRELSQSFDPDRLASPVFIAEPSGLSRRLR